MGLDATIRAAVATVKSTIGDLLVTVTHEPFLSRNGDGLPTYDTAVEYQAFMERKDERLAWRIGSEHVPSHMVTFLENVTVTMNDRITLPDGSAPKILDVRGVQDPNGGQYYTQVIFGRPERGTSAT